MKGHFPKIVVGSVFAVLLYGAFGSVCAAQSATAPPAKPMKITQSFTLAAVSDIQMNKPIAQFAEPGFQNFIKILRDADVAFANNESGLATAPNPKAVAADLKAMGIRMMSRANNHALDNGVQALFQNRTLLDEAGIVHAGTGKDALQARAPGFLTTAKGTVGLVAMYSIDRSSIPEMGQFSGATYPFAGRPGEPGVNALHVTPSYVVTPDALAALRKTRDAIYHPELVSRNEPADRLELFGIHYKSGPVPGAISYTMNPDDLREILRSIRNGKEYADFMIAYIHCHQFDSAWQKYSGDVNLREAGLAGDGVPDFLVDLAHQAIDNGADAFVMGGVHTMRGIEIYKGKPIFYGMSGFIALGAEGPSVLAVEARDGKTVDGVTQRIGSSSLGLERLEGRTGEVIERPPSPYAAQWGAWGVQEWGGLPNNMDAQLATSRYEGGRLVEVRVYPVDLGLDGKRRASQLGIPMTPSAAIGRQILEKIQRLSKPFGTTISIEGNVGVIRVPPEVQQSRK